MYEIYKQYMIDGGMTILCLLTLIQIIPIKINPWTHIGNRIKEFLNKDLEEKIIELNQSMEDMNAQISDLEYRFNEYIAIAGRIRITRFGDEITHEIRHSRDHYRQIMEDITNYNHYCDEHSEFRNNMTSLTVKRITEDFEKRDKSNDFL